MNQEQYLLLFEKYMAGNASSEEIEKIMSYNDTFDFSTPSVSEIPPTQHEIHAIKDRIQRNIKYTLDVGKVKSISSKSKWFAAASIVVLCLLGLIFQKNRALEIGDTISLKKHSDAKGLVISGTSKAILTVENGRQIVLNDASNGTLVKQGNVIVKRQQPGVLRFDVSGGNINAPIGFNTIRTPRGGEYQIVLSDGTKVWLNAVSTLKFPSRFSGKERRVELTGEAYFEVAENKKQPFIVSANGAIVQVLGTHFNVSAYSDDESVNTTLIEGSVRLMKNKTAVMLMPGQIGTTSGGSQKIMVKKANLEHTMAWKNGYFLFDDLDLKTIMKQAARWYDIDVEYKGSMGSEQYSGKISKYKDISQLLENLKLTGTVNFKLEGRRVIVMR